MKDRVLYEIQKNFPLTKHPYKEIAKRLGTNEDSIINIVKDEKDRGIIRQISAIFDTKKLGYDSSLVALKVDDDAIESAVKIINSHPGVSHNYERDHEFNIWFTIAIPPSSKLGLENSVKLISKLANAKEYIILPTLKLFKIAVKLDTTGVASKKESVKKRDYKDIKLQQIHKDIIKYTQEDSSVVSEPFKEIIEKLGITYETFFEKLNELKDAGMMRRYAAILNHRKAGFNANAMVVWDIDEDKAVEAGEKLASFRAVSHCYLRPKYPNWNYNIFTMVHGKTKDQTNSIVKEMEKEVQFNSNRYLYSSREFKKVRVKYYTNDIDEWEKQYRDGA